MNTPPQLILFHKPLCNYIPACEDEDTPAMELRRKHIRENAPLKMLVEVDFSKYVPIKSRCQKKFHDVVLFLTKPKFMRKFRGIYENLYIKSHRNGLKEIMKSARHDKDISTIYYF